MTRRTKQSVVESIAELCGEPAPPMSTGSTEPREIFDMCAEAIGIEGPFATKPEAARAVAEAGGMFWGADCDSRGGTVTLRGLLQVEAAMRLLLGSR